MIAVMRMPRHAIWALLALLVVTFAGCGGDDVSGEVDRARDRLEARVADAREEFDERRERYGRRIREVLEDLERVVPRAQRTSPTVRSRGRNEPETIDVFMTRVLDDIDGYWERTFAAADLPQPSVSFSAVPPGAVRLTACGTLADDSAAFYCPSDDTIYVAQQFAADLYRGVLRGLPGERAGYGRAAGDFAVAYVLAHEYAHNLQQELGTFDNGVGSGAKPYELQADCLAGTWAHSVFEQGLLEPGDLEEATNAALAVGDFDVGNAQHHGRPEERRDALLTGYDTGEPAQCNRFVEAS
ncbi:MAG: YpfJ protein, zinc metalloprotease superfamily [uncultured Solirubrobacteraceae bacterium]|uniref:YpfJ protein, zinc metalloprotease superfamily n=1 Tax=uncultured Solirubrobacteraceae bacterium TaxID=1162706 RepID=A0A6J4TEE1_9ACTN|nr:MAG: YpfJ protein, zinc metalloprotease superfamily [uncultured Solirubrobacteraceae bacterium]